MDKHSIIAVLMLAVSFAAGISAAKAGTQLTITDQNGSARNIELSTLGKITFDSANLMFYFQNGESESLAISSVKKMAFTQLTSLPEAPETSGISIYPNPAADYLVLDKLPAGASQVSIYSISGKLMMSCTIKSVTGQLTVSQLPDGFYVLKINNQAFKFLKK